MFQRFIPWEEGFHDENVSLIVILDKSTDTKTLGHQGAHEIANSHSGAEMHIILAMSFLKKR